MRIVHVEAGRHLFGGAGQVLYLLQGLQRLGGENLLVCPRGSAVAEKAAAFATVCEVPWRFEADWAAAAGLLRVIRRHRPDVLHAHSRRSADWFTALAAGASRLPAVLTRRVDNPESGRLARWKYRRYRAVVAISRAVADVMHAQAEVAPAQLRLIPDAVDSERFRPVADRGLLRQRLRKELGLPGDGPIGAMVAQFIPRKGHAVLLQALEPVFARHPDLTVLLFGRGSGERDIRAQVQQRGWQPRVRFAGFRQDLDRLLPAVDFLVHPALAEGLGVALLEGAACGLPVVAAAAGGIPEVVLHGQTGLLVPSGEAPPLAQALLDLLDDEEARRCYGRAARERIEREFSVAAMTRAYADLYAEVAGS